MKKFVKKYWILCIAIVFTIMPLLLNVGLYLTDLIYNKYGLTLTAKGLTNQEWLDFWGKYLSVVIAFLGICVAWKTAHDDRKKEKNEKLMQEYKESLKEEKAVIIEVCQSFDTDIIYKAILEWNGSDTRECKRMLQNARDKVLNGHMKFELITDIADSFQKCQHCKFNPCYDKENMIAIRDLFYEMETLYLKMIVDCVTYIDKLEKQRINKEQIHRNEEMIQKNREIVSLLQQKGMYIQEENSTFYIDDIKKAEADIERLNFEIEELKKEEIDDEESRESIISITESINSISQNMKPKLISYCKSYIELKNRHKRELLQDGKIQYIKYPQCEDNSNSQN